MAVNQIVGASLSHQLEGENRLRGELPKRLS